MTQWYVKELSKLTQVSVRTLHHYDALGLLKPSVRLPNGYRLYSEGDLLKLQQIIALKYFGFELAQIQNLLSGSTDIVDHFSVQSQLLAQKGQMLMEASQTLKSIIASCSDKTTIPWEKVMKLIEVYRMTQQLEKTWAGKILTVEELKEYASFEASLKTRFTAEEQKTFEHHWASLIGIIGCNLNKDPSSDFGIDLGKQCMDLINTMYGKKHAALRSAIWEKGYKTGQMDDEHALPPDIVIWLDKAMDAYYRSRLYAILNKVEATGPSDELLKMWHELIEEMYGDSTPLKDAIYKAAMTDDKVGKVAKAWLAGIGASLKSVEHSADH